MITTVAIRFRIHFTIKNHFKNHTISLNGSQLTKHKYINYRWVMNENKLSRPKTFLILPIWLRQRYFLAVCLCSGLYICLRIATIPGLGQCKAHNYLVMCDNCIGIIVPGLSNHSRSSSPRNDFQKLRCGNFSYAACVGFVAKSFFVIFLDFFD